MSKARMGRPPLSAAPSVKFTLRLTPEQKAKLDSLGGAEWIRDRIERAKKKEAA